MRSSKSWRHFVLQVFSIHRRRKRSFDWPNPLLHFRCQKMRYFHSTRYRPIRTLVRWVILSLLAVPSLIVGMWVHVGKTMIVIALFWLARRTGAGVLLIDLLGKGLTPRPSVGDRGSLWWPPGLHDNLYLDVEKLKRDVWWTDTGHMTLSGWQSLSFQSYIHRFMSECRRSVLKNIFMRLQA